METKPSKQIATSSSKQVQVPGSKLLEAAHGRVLAPMLLWIAGVPFGLVLVIWFFFFRGH